MGNHWVGHSVVKLVDDESFQKSKDNKEWGNKKHDEFDMEILE